MKNMQQITLTMYQSQKSQQDQQKAMQENQGAMGQAFDNSKNDDSFYLPPEVFDNADFKRGLKMFVSPDGKAVRFIISHEGDPATPEGINAHPADQERSVRGHQGHAVGGLEDLSGGYRVDVQGHAGGFELGPPGRRNRLALPDLHHHAVAHSSGDRLGGHRRHGVVVVGTSFGLSVLIWEHVLGKPLHWLVLAMSVIILLAVGSDYNLLLVSRFKEEIHAGIKTGIIRSMAGTGAVVTSAGLVFAFTMMSMVVSDLVVAGQVGTTIGLGLLFDTLMIRSFMTPSIAAMMGRWFWWPQNVRTRPRPCHGRHRRSTRRKRRSVSAPVAVAMAVKTQRAQSDRDVMKGIHLASVAAAAIAPARAFAAPAHADPDVAAALLKHWKNGKALATFTPEL